MQSPSEFNIGSSHATEKREKLEEFVARLEQEKVKIKGFTRELPLCMQLLTNAVEASRQELQSHRMTQRAARLSVLENSASSSSDMSEDKANWMTSARLWNPDFEGTDDQSPLPLVSRQQSQRVNIGEGAFCNFSRIPSPELSLASSEVSRRQKSSSVGDKEKRKARRCWSPHLHRRFLNALQMLGGSQLATPKQITQLMKVDGLTNDEVKSHLQKYRLHTRIQNPSPVVVLRGMWVQPRHGGAPAAAVYGATTRRVPPLSFDYSTNMFFHAT